MRLAVLLLFSSQHATFPKELVDLVLGFSRLTPPYAFAMAPNRKHWFLLAFSSFLPCRAAPAQ